MILGEKIIQKNEKWNLKKKITDLTIYEGFYKFLCQIKTIKIGGD